MTRSKKLAVVFDVLLVVGAAIALWPFVRSSTVAAKPSEPPALALIKPGSTFSLPGGVLSGADRHLVLIVRSTCPACNEGTVFYRQLADQARSRADVRLIVASPEPRETMLAWLAEHRIQPHDVVQAQDFEAQGVSIVPSLLFVDRAGIVTDVMLRKLAPADEGRVRARLDAVSVASLDNTDYAEEITAERYPEVLRERRAQLLDVRDRASHQAGHLEGARNIPLDELRTRAAVELDTRRPVLIDCATLGVSRCRTAGQAVRRLGYDVMLLLRP